MNKKLLKQLQKECTTFTSTLPTPYCVLNGIVDIQLEEDRYRVYSGSDFAIVDKKYYPTSYHNVTLLLEGSVTLEGYYDLCKMSKHSEEPIRDP
jgi:hypothetical protein